jgi:hypothetical protein
MIMFGVSGVWSIARKYRRMAPIASRIPTIAISLDFMINTTNLSGNGRYGNYFAAR